MARNIIAVIIGIVAAGIATYFVESINTRLFPLPDDLNLQDIEAMKEHVASLPATAFIIVLIAHFIGALFGGLVSAKIAASYQMKVALFVGAFVLIMGLINLFMIPHPIWFMVVDIFMYLPGAYAGYRIYQKYWPNNL